MRLEIISQSNIMHPTVSDNWYETFFTGVNCELWERAATPEWTEQEVTFLIKALLVKPGDRILDIPCGNGRHAISLAQKGFQMCGVDLSQEFIEKLQAKLNAENLPMEVIHANILTVSLNGTFNGAYCLGNSFGYFNKQGMKTFIEKVANALSRGARFIINSGMVEECSILTTFKEHRAYTLGDLTMEIKNTYVKKDRYMISELTFSGKDRPTEVHAYKHYVYSLDEIKQLLQENNLKTIAVYSSTDEAEFRKGDHQIYLVAEKE